MCPQPLPKQLETAVQIHAHRFFRQSAERSDFASRAALDQAQEQRLAIGLGQVANRRQRLGRLVLLIRSAPGERTISELDFDRCPADEVDRVMARQRADPAAERGGFAKRRQVRPGAKEHFLRKIRGLVRRHPGKQDGVHEPAESRVELSERVAIAGLSRPDERNVVVQKFPCSRIRIV